MQWPRFHNTILVVIALYCYNANYKGFTATVLKLIIHIRKKWMKWSTYFVTVTPSEQVESRLQAKDDLDQVSMSDFYNHCDMKTRSQLIL